MPEKGHPAGGAAGCGLDGGAGRLSSYPDLTTKKNPLQEELLAAILGKLDRGDAPDSKYPDGKGEHWALCPYHQDQHATNFSVAERGYKCFACGAQGGLRELAEKLGVSVAVLRGGVKHNIISSLPGRIRPGEGSAPGLPEKPWAE